MNGAHDMGGMHGFGGVDTADDARFHADWERLVFATDKVLRSQGLLNIDQKRHAIERLDPATYLGSTYFERWLAAWEAALVEEGLTTEDELAAALEAVGAGNAAGSDLEGDVSGRDGEDERDDGELATRVLEAFESDASYDREPREPRFGAGDRVVVRNAHPEGHTRCPRYARRAGGTVRAVQGTFVLPDASARGEEAAEPLYSVGFDAGELWGPDAEADDRVYVDLWESYLDAA